MNQDLTHLKYILGQIKNLKKISIRDRNDIAIELACQKLLENIGESCSKISKELKKQFPEIMWKEIVGMRNILIHNYFGVDSSEVWEAVDNDIVTLEKQIKNIIKTIKQNA
ncbi:MAG: HepT-like ribonuclease domain-containing protein [Rickettsiales bacterium]|nr:HepT-like ribonuclease domain-containing protein [Rickettsiales bacterium]